jgi:iron complex transport system substrate-binding protein
VSLDDVERALSARFSARPQVVALEPNSLADLRADILRLAHACGVEDRGMDLVRSIDAQMREIGMRGQATGHRPRVAAIEWQEPLMAAGNWVPEMLDLLGAENLFGRAGVHSPWMRWEELVASDPDTIICLPCGYDLERTRAEMHWLTGRPGWKKLRAVSGEKVYISGRESIPEPPGATHRGFATNPGGDSLPRGF